ncbi:MAG: hypothetical protein RL518_1957 [Pseudomonadota bacterium]
MKRPSDEFEKLSGSLDERFEFLEAVAGTLTAKAYRAVDVTTKQEVTVWRTRGPLQSAEISRFQERLTVLYDIPRVGPIFWSGIDARGVGFAVLPAYDGRRVDCSGESSEEIQQRFDACAAVLEALHDRSVTCGDLCLESFLLSDRNGVSLFAVLGDVALQSQDEEINLSRYEAFRPRGQKRGGAQPPTVDVYALERIGEGLAAVPVKGNVPKPNSQPTWYTRMLHSISSEGPQPEQRSVRALRRALTPPQKDAKSGTIHVSSTKKRDERPKVHIPPPGKDGNRPSAEGKGPHTFKGRSAAPSKGPGNRPSPKHSNNLPASRLFLTAVHDLVGLLRHPSRVLVLAVLNIGALGVLLYSYVAGRVVEVQVKAQQVAADTNKKENAFVVSLYDSQDPGAYQKLVDLLSETNEPFGREKILKVLVFRARRQGFARTADVILDQLSHQQSLTTFGRDELSRPLVRMLDTTLPSNARLDELATLYPLAPRLAAILAAASVLDTGEVETYRGLLVRAVSDQTGIADGVGHSSYALMLLLSDVHDLFSQDIIEHQETIPASDIVWLLAELGRQGRPEVSTVAQVAERRGITSGAHVVFLRELRRSAALKQQMRNSLVSGALGKLSLDDVRRFGAWYGAGSPRVLEASILTDNNETVKSAAFDALSGKPIEDPYVSRLLEFTRNAYGAESSRYGGLVAAVALRDVVGTDPLQREFEVLNEAPRRAELLRQLVNGAPPEVIEMVLQRYGSSLDVLDIVDLLNHGSPQVRIAAISSLTDVNDILLLKLITQSYDQETDPQVRAAYEAKISVIRERL